MMDALHRDGIEITWHCVDSFANELEHLIRDSDTRTQFIKRWKEAIKMDIKESIETTGSLQQPPPPKISPKSARSMVIEELRKTPPTTERPLEGVAYRRQMPTEQDRPQLERPIIQQPQPLKEWLLSDDDARQLASKYPVRIYGIRAAQDLKRKRGTHGHGSIGFNRTGNYFLILNDGFLQLSHGMIEVFFKRAEITMHGFFTD